MADNKKAWQDATQRIVSSLDIAAGYRALGVDVCGNRPNAKGWIECRAFGLEDRTPSAGINVGDTGLRGRYKDFRTGETLTLFDFAATKAGKFGGDWREARKHYAHQTGVELPSGEDEYVADRFEFSDLTAGVMVVYAGGKPGVTVQSIRDVGGRYARWPKKLPAEKTNHLIAFPMYGEALLEVEPTGWHCVAAKPTSKIRKFKGKGHEDELLDKMTAGDYGLLNQWGLGRIADAEVINVVEGLTDLLAGQAVLRDWVDADADNRKHIIITAGACTYHPKAEWMQHFAGKEVRLWFDVGDSKDEGQIAAAVWVKSCLPVASSVRNVQLPLGPEGGKNDLRAWLVGDPVRGLASHNYADMCDLAETVDPVQAEDKTAALSSHEAILRSLGLNVIGEYEGRQMVEVFAETRSKPATIHDVDKLSIAKLAQLVGGEVVEQFIHDGRETPPGKFQMKDVRFAIAHVASDKLFFGDEKFGAGVWEHDGQLVLVKEKEIGILNGSGKVEASNIPFANGRILDCTRGSRDWYNLDTINSYLTMAEDHDWCRAVIVEAMQVFDKWNWRQKKEAPMMVTGLVICSWLQSIWQWRPQVFVTGNSNTGKSVLLQNVIAEGIFGDLSMYVEKPTEAAISQVMRHHSRVLFIDEFEKDFHRQKVLELLRTTSRGGVKIRGTADHKGVQFRLRHLPWLSAIEHGLSREADRNRYIILELDIITEEKSKGFSTPSMSYLRDLGMRLFAIGLAHYQEARRLFEVLKIQQSEGVPSRCVESFALPISMISAAVGDNEKIASGLFSEILSGWDFVSQRAADHVDCLSTILTSTVDMRGGQRVNVSTLLETANGPDVKEALNRIGVRRIRKHAAEIDGPVEVLWIYTDVCSRTLLKGTKYEGHVVEQYLLRFPGADYSRQKLGGTQSFQGVEIPINVVMEHFKPNRSDEQYSDDEEFI
jgi:hypothetical protein